MKARRAILILSGLLLVICFGLQPWTSLAQGPIGSPKLRVLLGKSLIVNSDEPLRRVSVSNPEVASALIISEKQVLIHGLRAASVSLILWTQEEQPRTFDLEVLLDIARVRDTLRSVLPTDDVEVSQSGASLVLTGIVSSDAIAQQALAVAQTQSGNVVNLIQVTANREMVLLQVRFAEVDRQRATELGFNVFSTGAANTFGSFSTQQFSPPTGSSQIEGVIGADVEGSSAQFRLVDLLNLFIFRPDINLGLTLRALETRSILQILAEPNILAVNGSEASFLAGGEFPFPIVQGGTSQAITIQFREFGVRLTFTPEIQEDGMIRLKVEPEVSALDFANAVSVSGFLVPALSTRRAETEVELQDGQSFAIAGLIDNRTIVQANKIPLLGDIPVLGHLFRSKSVDKSNSELLVTVTPRLVNALEPGQMPEGPDFPVPFMDIEDYDRQLLGKPRTSSSGGGR